MSRGAGGAGILCLVGLERASLAARTSGLRGRGGEASGGAGDLRRAEFEVLVSLFCSFACCRSHLVRSSGAFVLGFARGALRCRAIAILSSWAR